MRAFVSTGPSSLLLVRHIIRSQWQDGKSGALCAKQCLARQTVQKSAGNQSLAEHWSLTYTDERILDDYLKEIRTPRERFIVERQAMMGIKGLPRFVRVREETRKVDAAGLIRVDGNAYLLPRELAQKEVQLLVDDVSIVVTRKARVIAELDKVDSVYKPRVQKESLRPEKLPHLPQIPDPLYCCNNLQRSLDVYDLAVRRG